MAVRGHRRVPAERRLDVLTYCVRESARVGLLRPPPGTAGSLIVSAGSARTLLAVGPQPGAVERLLGAMGLAVEVVRVLEIMLWLTT